MQETNLTPLETLSNIDDMPNIGNTMQNIGNTMQNIGNTMPNMPNIPNMTNDSQTQPNMANLPNIDIQQNLWTELDLGHKKVHIRKWKVKDRNQFLELLKNDSINASEKKILNILVLNCIKEKDIDLNPEELQYIFLKIRELSIGDEFDFQYTCEKCGNINKSTEKISEIFTFTYSEFQERTYGNIVIKYSNVKNPESFNKRVISDDFDELDDLCYHIESINGKMYKFQDVKNFFENLDTQTMDIILKDFYKMQFLLNQSKEFKCSECENKKTFIFDEIPNFFPDSWFGKSFNTFK